MSKALAVASVLVPATVVAGMVLWVLLLPAVTPAAPAKPVINNPGPNMRDMLQGDLDNARWSCARDPRCREDRRLEHKRELDRLRMRPLIPRPGPVGAA